MAARRQTSNVEGTIGQVNEPPTDSLHYASVLWLLATF